MQSIRQLAANLSADFPPPKRGRGRPPKPALPHCPCEEPFNAVAVGVRALAQRGGGAWAIAKEQARNWADRIPGFSPATPKVLGYLLSHINQEKGFDWHSAERIARDLGLTVRTIERAYYELRRVGAICRCLREEAGVGDPDARTRHPKASKPWVTTLPILVAAGKGLLEPDKKFSKEPTGKSTTRQKMQEGPDENVGLIRKEEYEGCSGSSARARENTEDEAVQSFLNGEDFAKPEVLKSTVPDGLTELHLERFRELSDTFGRRPGAVIVRATARSESDHILIEMVRSELGEYPAPIVARTVTAAQLAAAASQISAQQDGSAGRGRGGIVSLQRYLRPMLRSTASDMMREEHASEAKNRSEKVVQETRHATRLSAVQAAKGRRQAPHSMGDALRAAFATANAGDET
jgi:hypothetical protein